MHFNIPPQPWQGNPEAKLWVLLTNPGYKDEDASFYSEPKHRKAPLAQLQFKRLERQHWHYVMNDEHRNWNGNDGRNDGSYSWIWFRDRFVEPVKKVLGIGNEKAFEWLDKNVFLLQTHGYASEESIDDIYLYFHSQARFIRKLLQWGVENKKIMYIVRKEVLWRYWLDDTKDISKQMIEDKQIKVNENPRNSNLPLDIIQRIDGLNKGK